MPITLEQLKLKQRQNPEQFKKDQQAMFAFSKLLWTRGNELMKEPKSNYHSDADYKLEYSIGEKLRDTYSEAFAALHKDPSDPKNREQIEKALDTLATFGDFLGGPDEPHSNMNVCLRVQDPGISSELEDGLKAFNRVCGFGLNVDSLIRGEVDKSTQEEREAREAEMQRWREQRAADEKALEDRERLAQERERVRREEQRRREEERKVVPPVPAPENANPEEIRNERENERNEAPEILQEAGDAFIAEENQRKREIEESVRKRQEEFQRAQDEHTKNVLQQRDLKEAKLNELQASITPLFLQAQNRRAPAADRKASLAQAAANQMEYDTMAKSVVGFSQERVDQNYQTFLKAFTVEERTGRLDALASRHPDAFRSYVNGVKEDINYYAGPTEFGLRMNPLMEFSQDWEEESVDYSRTRANSIFQQMDRTWRVVGNSKQFEAAKKAMQDLAGTNRPQQEDHYLAGEIVKEYIAKNLNAAKSAVGMTRMACSLAFLKQTMSENSFRVYCNSLNRLRNIPERITEDAEFGFDKTAPRCIVPDEIGTVKEVYQTAKKRIETLSREEKAPTPRELAILTALKNLQQRSRDGENTVVEHEALQAEIVKVQRDPRFAEVLKRPVNEQLMMAWEGNLDTLEGCRAGLKPDQEARIHEENEKKAAEAKRLADEAEQRRKEEIARKEEEERRLKEEAERKAREEEERQRRAEEFRKFREKNKTLDEVLDPLRPTMEKVSNPNAAERAIEEFRDDPVEEYTGLAANLIAIWELAKAAQKAKMAGKGNEYQKEKLYINQDDLNKRVNELKNDPIVRKMGVYLRDDPEAPKMIEEYRKAGAAQKRNQETYAFVELAHKLKEAHANEHDCIAERLYPKRWPSVAQGYQELKKNVDQVSNGKGGGYKNVGILAAKMVALREIELKGKDGLNNKVNIDLWKKRAVELYRDPLFDTIGQNLSGPKGEKELARAFNMKPNREQAFADYVNNMYHDLKLQREQKKQNAQNAKEQNDGGVQIHP